MRTVPGRLVRGAVVVVAVVVGVVVAVAGLERRDVRIELLGGTVARRYTSCWKVWFTG